MRILDLFFSDIVFGLGMPLLITAGGILLSDEFKRFKKAKICFYLAAVWICGRVLMWSVFTSDATHVRILATFLAFGAVGVGLTETVRAANHREGALKTSEQEPPKPPPIQQNSKGANSPNTNVTGNNNTVTNNITIKPPEVHAPPPQPRFRENTSGTVYFFLGEHGMSFGRSIEMLREMPWAPFVIRNPNGQTFPLATLWVKGNTILVSVKVGGGGGPSEPVIEVKDNNFIVRDPFFDRNSNESALEVVDSKGVPIFQLIQKTPTQIVLNGYFPLPGGGVMIAGPDGTVNQPTAQQTANFRLKPIFKYPAWKYPGQYAD
jgi:hypothetical protein